MLFRGSPPIFLSTPLMGDISRYFLGCHVQMFLGDDFCIYFVGFFVAEFLAARGSISRQYRSILESHQQVARMYSAYSSPEKWGSALQRIWSIDYGELSSPLTPKAWQWVITGDQEFLHPWYTECESEQRQTFFIDDVAQPVSWQ